MPISEYKITERELYEKFGNLSEKELNTKSNKTVYIRNDVVTTIIKRCKGKKKRGIRAIDGFRKNDSRFWNFCVSRIWNQIKNREHICERKILEEYPVKIDEIDPYFYEHYGKKYKLIKMGVNIYYLEVLFILLNIS